MRKWLLFCTTPLMAISLCRAQPADSLSIVDCYTLAEQHYPLVKRYDLIAKTAAYSLDNLQKGYLPQFEVNAQASYQSAVTAIPIHLPGVDIPVLSKDQYKAYAEIDQVLYDGGEIARQKEWQKNNETVARQELAVDLYQLKDRIDQLFFGVLLIDGQLKQNDLLVKDLQLGLDKTQASIKNGTAFRSNADLISAALLQTRQHAIELRASRKAYTDMLGLFIGRPVHEYTVLATPAQVIVSDEIKRPELAVFDAQAKALDVQNQLLTVGTRPRIGVFLQGGYGRPGLDMLDNNFAAYYVGGIHLSWSPSAFYTLKRKRAQIDIDRREVAVQKENFLFNTDLTIRQQSSEIDKYRLLSASDDEIVGLREQVKNTAMAQLENGVITGNDFLKEVNDEDQARQNKWVHYIQLLMAQYKQQTTTGNQP